ncbi:response regulator [Chloroflexota bacterium]
MGSFIKVLIVDDQQMFREGIRRRLEQEADICIVGEAGTAEEALEQVEQVDPNIVILDIRLPDVSGIEVARRMRRQWPDLKILMLSSYDFDQYVSAAARIGIQGYLVKDAPQEELVQAIHIIASGGAALPPHIASKVMKNYSTAPPRIPEGLLGELTIREIDVLELMYQGYRNTDIAEHLAISPRTVEAHVSNVISKLGAQSRIEAVHIAVEKGYIR